MTEVQSAYKYVDCKDVNQGGFGSIIRAVQQDGKTGRPLRLVAIKKVNYREQSERSIIQQDPKQEIEIMKRLDHPNIVNYLDSFSEEKTYFIVMEYVPLNLSDVIYNLQIPLSMQIIKAIMKQILQGLRYLHDAGVVHRDLKPRNLLLDPTGLVRICDFGQAYQTTHLAGTRNYKAPEALLNIQNGPAADVFSAGCVLFELLARRPLFTSNNDIQLITHQNIIIGPLSACPIIAQSEDFQKIILQDDFEVMENLTLLVRQYTDDIAFLDLLKGMLHPDPGMRWDAVQCLESTFFATSPGVRALHQFIHNTNGW